MYLRKMSPSTVCLYSAASMLLRSLSAAKHILASKPRLAAVSFVWLFFFATCPSCLFKNEERSVSRSTNDASKHQRPDFLVEFEAVVLHLLNRSLHDNSVVLNVASSFFTSDNPERRACDRSVLTTKGTTHDTACNTRDYVPCLLLAHSSECQEPQEPKLATDLKELSWLIGKYDAIPIEDENEIIGLRIGPFDDGKAIRASYRIRFSNQRGQLPTPINFFDVDEVVRWDMSEQILVCNYSNSEAPNARLNPQLRDSHAGEGTYKLKRIAEWKGS